MKIVAQGNRFVPGTGRDSLAVTIALIVISLLMRYNDSCYASCILDIKTAKNGSF